MKLGKRRFDKSFIEYNDITILEVFDEDVCKNGVYFTETLNSGNFRFIKFNYSIIKMLFI